MRLTKEKAAENRSAILEAAGRLFRERGFDAVSVADLMDAAGFTHGGFYNHFPSKEALAREAVAAGLTNSAEGLRAAAKPASPSLASYVEPYLSPAHRDAPSRGCTMSALAGDAGRQSREVQEPFSEGIETFVSVAAAELLARDGGKGKRAEAAARAKALRMWSELLGALTLARAVAAANPELSDEILAASRQAWVAKLTRK